MFEIISCVNNRSNRLKKKITKLQMASIIKSRNRGNGEGTNGTSHFGQTAQVRLTKVQTAQVVGQMA